MLVILVCGKFQTEAYQMLAFCLLFIIDSKIICHKSI